jgi:hypothetical protein
MPNPWKLKLTRRTEKEDEMTEASNRPPDNYAPLYFLTSLGCGGLTVTFFMWLMHWTRHPGRSVPVFEDILVSFSAGGAGVRVMIALAVAGIAFYTFLNIKYLLWNLVRFRHWKRTPAYAQLCSSNAETQLLAMPLALAMTVNVCFILAMVFVPGLWSVVEYLFPLAILAFLAMAENGANIETAPTLQRRTDNETERYRGCNVSISGDGGCQTALRSQVKKLGLISVA